MTVTSKRFAVAALAWMVSACLTLAPDPVRATDYYDVVGVQEDDALNVRTNVAGASALSDTEVVGGIPWDAKEVLATGVATTLGGTLWREVRYGNTQGFVSDDYLRPSAGLDLTTAPVDLDCTGTEPFWSLRVRGAAGTFQIKGENAAPLQLKLDGSFPAVGQIGMWQLVLRTPMALNDRLALLTRTWACSDGMSDLIYAYELILMERHPTSGPLQGCCSLPR